MARTVLARREKSMIGWRWSGDEPAELNDLDLALLLGAQWEGDELVHYDTEALQFQLDQFHNGAFMNDND